MPPPPPAPTSPSLYLLTPTATQLNTLHHSSTLLHLFHHRNKNQHRRSIWWRAHNTFRRQLSQLLKSYTSLLHVPETATARHKKKATDRETTTHIQSQLTFWTEILVPRWMSKFSNLVADGRWAVLGVFLTGVLAEVCAVVGINAVLEESAQREFEAVLGRFENETWGEDGKSEVGLLGKALGRREGEDVGVVLRRDDDDEDENANEAKIEDRQERIQDVSGDAPDGMPAEESPVIEEEEIVVQRPRKREFPVGNNDKTTDRERMTKQRKKGKRKGNAIDDLFSGL